MTLRIKRQLRLHPVEQFTTPSEAVLSLRARYIADLLSKGYAQEDAQRWAQTLIRPDIVADRVGTGPSAPDFLGGPADVQLLDPDTDVPLELWFLTWPSTDDRRDSYVRINAPTLDAARTFAARRYHDMRHELVDDITFNPDLYPDGEIDEFWVGAS